VSSGRFSGGLLLREDDPFSLGAILASVASRSGFRYKNEQLVVGCFIDEDNL
jgi:hypothetical protein